MTLEELDVSLPNGLHDAQIERMDIDYLHARLTLSVQVLFGLPAQPDSAREEYRVGALMFHGVQFVSIEFPQPGSAFQQPGELWFSYERTPSEVIPVGVASTLPSGALCYSMFVRDWLSYIHVAATDVSISFPETVAHR
jgi:hypothetical protein